ncbi:MAG: D-alanyl-D-alanine carboxypeptidase/D-alanyl-D-alanine-endopeptidase [Pseudomonadota bacterium]
MAIVFRLICVLWLIGLAPFALAGPAEQLVRQFGLSGSASVALMDLDSGQLIDAYQSRKALPPASVAKAVTVPYALDSLGSDFRFETTVIATGPINGGLVQGDIVLRGGGDPLLDTDGLFQLVQTLKSKGVRGVTGRFLFADGAISNVKYVDGEQPDHVGYNPALSGLNLNFNRVYFEWEGGELSLTAKSDNHAPPVSTIDITTSESSNPVFRFDEQDDREVWIVAEPALKRDGSRWLPVRDPGRYAAEVFRTLAKDAGITLPEGQEADGELSGTVLASGASAPLLALSRSMLRFSTNLTAEVVGMRASGERGDMPEDHRSSAQAMTRWASSRYKVNGVKFMDHSGLSDGSKASARALARIIRVETNRGLYPALLKNIPLEDAPGLSVRAKTGTLNFTSTLAGVIEGPKGRYAFAILFADEAARAKIKRQDRERPAGARTWIRSARSLQKTLLVAWGDAYLR